MQALAGPFVDAAFRYMAMHPQSLVVQVSGMRALLSLYLFCPEVVTTARDLTAAGRAGSAGSAGLQARRAVPQRASDT